MAMNPTYATQEPRRDEVDALPGATVVEFGTPWCGFCMAAQPRIATAFEAYPEIRHLKIEDGRGRRLGRSFGVKLWPTLVFMKEGREVKRLVRPSSAEEIGRALKEIAGGSPGEA